MSYKETLNFLFTQTPVFEKTGVSAYKPGLQNVEKLDEWLGHPHTKYPCIHIAGTNGKGSVSNLTASILQEAGYRTGLFTSPHLKDFRERIRVNGKMISEENVVSFVDNYRKKFPEDFNPSFFEITTMMALDWFREEKVDVAVIEVGLGGRLDSTNIIKPVASVITNISMDHMDLLGDTPEKIAYEKAGIIKEGTPVVIGKSEGDVRRIFADTATSLSAPVFFADDEFKLNCREEDDFVYYSSCEGSIRSYKEIPCALLGTYQKENAATVLALMEVLKSSVLNISEKNIMDGFRNVLRNTGLRGRWDYLSREPRILCDTGHNEGGIRFVARQLEKTPHKTLHIVFGMVKDKDVKSVLKLLPKDAVYYFTRAQISRALPEDELYTLASIYGLRGKTYPTVMDALEEAKKNYRPGDLIFVGGSNYIISEII